MGKVITITILATILLGYGYYTTSLQTVAMAKLNNLEHIYANAEVSAAQMR